MINNVSKQLADFLKFIDTVQSEYQFCFDSVNQQDKLTSDYLHSLELGNMKCGERSKIATALVVNRKDRRYYKDRVEEFEPLIKWMEEPANARAINTLKQVLGQIRKQESYHENRIYIPRVLKEDKR